MLIFFEEVFYCDKRQGNSPSSVRKYDLKSRIILYLGTLHHIPVVCQGRSMSLLKLMMKIVGGVGALVGVGSPEIANDKARQLIHKKSIY